MVAVALKGTASVTLMAWVTGAGPFGGKSVAGMMLAASRLGLAVSDTVAARILVYIVTMPRSTEEDGVEDTSDGSDGPNADERIWRQGEDEEEGEAAETEEEEAVETEEEGEDEEAVETCEDGGNI